MMDEDRIAAFIRSFEANGDPFLARLRRTAEERRIPILKPETEALLSFFAELKKPERALEIGTAIGYSGTVLLKKSAATRLFTVENDEARASEAAENFCRAGVSDRVELFVEDASEVLPKLKGPFDLLFLDAAKAQYVVWLPELLRLMRPGSVLISDNVFREGSILESRYAIRRRDRTIHDRMRAFLLEIKRSDELESMILPLGDGVAVSVKKS